MRIEGIRVEGYGVFHDLELGPLGRLVAILGPNESGKTTLISFVRAILFGFPNGHGKENRYEPLSGGRHGGCLTLVDSGGQQFNVERFAGSRGGSPIVSSADGLSVESAILDRLLGEASREVFRAVFAFSLDELQDFGTLTRDDVQARIYGVKVGAGRVPVDEADAALSRQQAQLFAPHAKVRINQLLEKLELAETSLGGPKKWAAQHAALARQLERSEREIDQTRQEYLEKQEEIRHVCSLLEAWDDYAEYRAATGELRTLPDVDSFPAGGVGRLEAMGERRRAKGEDLDLVGRDLRRFLEESRSLESDRRLVELAPDLDRLRRGIGRYEAANKNLRETEEHLGLGLSALREVLQALGPRWNADRVANFDAPASAREEVRAHRAALFDARQALRDAENSLANRRENAGLVRSQYDRARRHLDSLQSPPDMDPGALDERRGKARRLYEAVVRQNETLAKRKALEERSNDLLAKLSTLRHIETKGQEFQPQLPLLVVCIMMAAVAAALLILDQYAAGAAVGIFLLLPVGLYVYISVSYPRASRKQLGPAKEEIRSSVSRLEAIEAQLEAVDGESEGRKTEIEGLAGNLGFADTVTLAGIQELESEMEAQSSALTEWRLQDAIVRDLAERAREAADQEQTSEAERARKSEDLVPVTHEWRSWLKSRGLDEELTPDGCEELLSGLDIASEKLRAVEELTARARSLRAEVETFEADARRLVEPHGFLAQDAEALPSLLDRLAGAVSQAARTEELATRLQASITEAREKAEVLREGLSIANGQIEQLLSEAGARDEEEFMARAAAFESRQRLLPIVNERARNLERLAGGGEGRNDFLKELEGTTMEKLHELHEQLDQESAALDRRRTELDRAHGDLQRQALELETEDESVGLRLESLVLRQQLIESAREWCVAAISKKLIQETRRFYERERQPEVIREAQSFFVQMTGARYRHIVSPLAEERLSVEDASGRTKDLAHLSRGTSEQLYLALRFGLVREFARRSEPLPVLMDDVLTNFDRQRAEQACAAIAELSATHQVILFTCHTSTAELLQSAADHCQVVRLPHTAQAT